jgi:hypothetical protein
VLLTRSPLEYPPKEAFPLDLHVLSTPPAFVLSQDQTLHRKHQQKTIQAKKRQLAIARIIVRQPKKTQPPQPQRPWQTEVQHTNQSIDKHTVEFSKIRRAPDRPRKRRSRGQPQKTYRSTPEGVKSDPARRAARPEPSGRPFGAARKHCTQPRGPPQTGVNVVPVVTVVAAHRPRGTAGRTARRRQPGPRAGPPGRPPPQR